MARIDFEAIPSVNPTGAPGGADYQRIPTSPATFGGAIGAGAEKLGQGAEVAGEATLGYDIAHNQLLNEVHGSEVNTWLADRLSDRWAAFSQLQGKAALDALPQFKTDITDLRNQAIARTQDLQERADLTRSTSYLLDRYDYLGALTARQQFARYANEVATRQVQSFGAQALLAATQDDPGAPAHMNRSLYASDDGVRKYGEQQHLDGDTIAQNVAVNRGKNVVDIVEALVADGHLDKASLIFSANRGAMDATSQVRAYKALRAPLAARRVATAAAIATGRPIDPSTFAWTEQSAGLPVGYIGGVMRVESRFGAEPDRPGSQYRGLAQFGDAERARYRITDPASIAQNASALVQEAEANAPQLRKVLGRPPSAAELYLAHQQGLAGAVAQLSNPQRPAWQNLAATAEGRAKGAAWAKTAVWNNLPQSAKTAFGSVDAVSGADFVRTVKGFYGSGGGAGSGVIDRAASFRRAQALFGGDPVLLGHVEAAIDHQWSEQEQANQERIADIKQLMPHLQRQIEDGDANAAGQVPADLGLLGSQAAQEWRGKIAAAAAVGAAKRRVFMAPADAVPAVRRELAAALAPSPGGAEAGLKTFDAAVRARELALNGGRDRPGDPAGYVAAHDTETAALLKDAAAANTPAAWQAYAAQTVARQRYLGAARPAVLAAADARRFQAQFAQAAMSDDAAARTALIGQVHAVAMLFGPRYWPLVVRQLAPNLQPLVRAVASGMNPVAAGRLLSLDPKQASVAKILSGVPAATTTPAKLTDAVAQAMKPFRDTMVGAQFTRDYLPYQGLATELAALYVAQDALLPDAAAAKAFADVIGARYDFRDSYRIPKSAGVDPDDVQAGAAAVRNRLSDYPIAPAIDDLGLGAEANAADSMAKFARDGRWVTAADGAGLNLTYDGRFVRSTDGKPFELSFAQLAAIGAQARPLDQGAAATAGGSVAP